MKPKKDKIKSLLPRIFKTTKRYSGTSKPKPYEYITFSPSNRLTVTELVPNHIDRDFGKPWIFYHAQGRVVRTTPNLVEVRFNDSKESDLISPEDLIKAELTDFGKAMLAHHPSKSAKFNHLLGVTT